MKEIDTVTCNIFAEHVPFRWQSARYHPLYTSRLHTKSCRRSLHPSEVFNSLSWVIFLISNEDFIGGRFVELFDI